MLSRLPTGHDRQLDEKESKADKGIICNIQAIEESLNLRTSTRIRQETMSDPDLKEIREYIINGWPDRVISRLRPFQQMQNNLSIENGLVLYGDRIVIPESLRKCIMQILHYGHFGVSQMKQMAGRRFIGQGSPMIFKLVKSMQFVCIAFNSVAKTGDTSLDFTHRSVD
ncbi:hypothetical protein RF11_14611 [Thelohanellus kitauei]|uniref:Integrase zinc-binding domain-containing protein n=1 Tax=Thelohanellus kitauei TaxID=669202 RepID=A0A0C2JPS6_THEKT|nr:hypothetical protein RF11_14611 [Thelohanellus kitauei]